MTMKNIFILCAILNSFFCQSFTQKYLYRIDIANVSDDKLKVELTCPKIEIDEIVYSFPASIPGSYMFLNYGNLIEDFEAFDSNGKKLDVKKISDNSYQIKRAKRLAKITYVADDSFDSKHGYEIRRQAGTNFDDGKNFFLNAAGIFGYFEGMEKIPIDLEFFKPSHLDGYSSLSCNLKTDVKQSFTAKNYHQLIDCPIMFTLPDTSSFKLGNCNVMIVSYAESGAQYAKLIADNIKPKIEAVGKFLNNIPVNDYTFIIYLKDMADIARRYKAGEIGKLELANIKLSGATKEGALEHNNSSTYYYVDQGDTSFLASIKNSTVHEFLHVITPLSLHSELIADFSYSNPLMSKHLWLYEGVVEYFNHLSLLQGGQIKIENYLQLMRQKIVSGSRFPLNEMSFTELSQNSLKDKYHDQYFQVYQRGPILAWLLDMEIIRLTDGTKNLKDVIFSLTKKFGPEKPFIEDNFFDVFVQEVHPELSNFFNNFIVGRENWDINKGLNTIGLEYYDITKVNRPRNILTDNDIKTKESGDGIRITETGAEEWAGLQVGDIVETGFYNKYFRVNDSYVSEGSLVTIPVNRNGKISNLTIKVQYKIQDTNYVLNELLKKSKSQCRYFNKWMGK